MLASFSDRVTQQVVVDVGLLDEGLSDHQLFIALEKSPESKEVLTNK